MFLQLLMTPKIQLLVNEIPIPPRKPDLNIDVTSQSDLYLSISVVIIILIIFLVIMALGSKSRTANSEIEDLNSTERTRTSDSGSGISNEGPAANAVASTNRAAGVLAANRSGSSPPAMPPGGEISGRAHVIDGDTVVIRNIKIRLAGIDAPELDQPWGQKSKWALVRLCKGKTIRAVFNGETSWDRLVGICHLPDGTDLGAELVKQGLALDVQKYSGGRYRHLEPPGARRKLWRNQHLH